MVEVNEGIGGPQFAAQFLPSDYLARLSKQANKNSEGLLLQFDLYAVLAQFAGAQVEFEKTKANRSRQVGIGHVQTPCGESSTAACLPYSIPQSGPRS